MPPEDYTAHTWHYTYFTHKDNSFTCKTVNVHVGQKVRIGPTIDGANRSVCGAFAFITDWAIGWGGEILYLIVCIISGEHNGNKVVVSPSEIEICQEGTQCFM